ncbi:MAG TPA: class I SAM-dependent methyltransferase [Bryobacteraceae bacterium]|nr:class I SAM-dependent methyltransferase [Bryobacteraceae bacterium]
MTRLALLIVATGLCCASAAQQPGEDRIWQDFVEWYRKQPAGDSGIRKGLLEHLKRSGLSVAEAERRATLIDRLRVERRDELHPLFFDRTYADPAPRFNTGPNATLVDAVRDIPPGRALDIHMGQGRNALYLASKGWDAFGFDFSAEGVRVARAASAKAGVKLTATVARHEDFDFGVERWDLIVMSYTWVPLRGGDMERIIGSLKPGGRVVFEHLMDESGGSGAGPWLPKPNELLEVFRSLRILFYEDVRDRADWSWRPERIARLIAEKPRAGAGASGNAR